MAELKVKVAPSDSQCNPPTHPTPPQPVVMQHPPGGFELWAICNCAIRVRADLVSPLPQYVTRVFIMCSSLVPGLQLVQGGLQKN